MAPIMARTAVYFAPFIFAAVPLVTLLADNIEDVAPQYAFRPVLAMLVVAALILGGSHAFLRDRNRSVVVACLLILVLSAGTIGEDIRALLPENFATGPAVVVQLSWTTLLLAATVMMVKSRHPPRDLGFILLAVSLPMVIIPARRIVQYELALRNPYPIGQSTIRPVRQAVEPLPDVYYIVLDGYGREDVLADIYHTDNGRFIASLEQLGFFVARNSLANYGQTSLSLASSLNMAYLDEVAEHLGEESGDHRPLDRLIRHNLVRRTLEGLGYHVYAFETGYRRTEWEDADSYLAPPLAELTAFEALHLDVMGLTPAIQWLVSHGCLDEMPGYKAHRDRIRFAFEQAASLGSSPSPKFVFLHIMLPHPPFTFSAQATRVSLMEPFQMKDGSEFNGTDAEYLQGYAAQVDVAGEMTLELVRQLIDGGTRPVVVLIQGDHGPGSRLEWDHPEQSDFRERLAILNAYYAPMADRDLYPSISPVNSFRVILNRHFGYDLALLPDRSYLSGWRSPYRLLEYWED